MTHEDTRALMPLYALGAVADHEAQSLARHLRTCPACAEALEADLEVAGALALCAEPVTPAGRVRQRLLAAAAAQLPSARLPAGVGRRRHGWPRFWQHKPDGHRQERFIAGLGPRPASVVSLTATGAGSASGRLHVAPDQRHARLVAGGLADPGTAVYQLWVIVGGKPMPLDPFRPDARGVALVRVYGHLAGGTFAISLEPKAGNRAPVGPIVLAST